jgi:serine/threonine protein phosphatase 1
VPDTPRQRLSFETWPAAVYAVGDVHGCFDQLRKLEAEIADDAAAIPGEKWIVMLGDYVDRGPAVPAVIEHLLSRPPPGFRRFALLGNHEKLLLDFLDNPPAHPEWLEWGGLETSQGYGMPPDPLQRWRNNPLPFAAELARRIPPAHQTLMRTLPICLSLPGLLLVHAGIRPGLPLASQSDEDLIWIRGPFLRGSFPPGLMIVHGHTPVDAVELNGGRIDIDTGCFFSGVLSGLRILPDGSLKLLQARGRPSDYVPASERL